MSFFLLFFWLLLLLLLLVELIHSVPNGAPIETEVTTNINNRNMEEHNTNGGTEERKYYYHEKENSSDDEEHDDYKDNGVHEDVPTWEKYPTGAEAPDRSLIYFPKGNSRIVDVAGGDLGVPQLVSPDTHDKILDIIQQARNHFEDFVKLDTAYSPVRQICKNKHENCALWATMGGMYDFYFVGIELCGTNTPSIILLNQHTNMFLTF